MKYSATLNGKKYEVELERVEEYAPIPRHGVADAAPTAPITAPAVKAAPATPAAPVQARQRTPTSPLIRSLRCARFLLQKLNF